MLNQIRPALTMIVLFTALLGLGYPLAVTGIAGAVMPAQAQGSLLFAGGRAVGSSLVGQAFTGDRYFHGRPSATGEIAYNAAASSGTNLGPTSAKLRDLVAAEVGKLQASGASLPVPADAATSSGSGLDPDISPAYARLQIARVAKARQLPEPDVAKLIDSVAEAPVLGFVGEPRVNVLKLNLALDRAAPQP